MRFWSTGITVISGTNGEEHHGMTVSSFTSVSLDPPLVLISIEQKTRTHRMIHDTDTYAVTILNQDQEWVSDRFAGRETEHLDRFEGVETFSLSTGCKFIKGGLAFFDCVVQKAYDAGNHTVFIGRVITTQIDQEINEANPLIYFNQEYQLIKK